MNDSIRHAILQRMSDLGYSTYKIAQLVKKEMCQATVYNFIEGMTDTTTRKASTIMEVLGLSVTIRNGN